MKEVKKLLSDADVKRLMWLLILAKGEKGIKESRIVDGVEWVQNSLINGLLADMVLDGSLLMTWNKEAGDWEFSKPTEEQQFKLQNRLGSADT